MDTGAASPMPRSSLKGSKSGQSPRRASFGGEITRRPIRKTSSAAVLSSSAATAASGGAGPLPRRQLDPRLFKSVSMEWTPQNGPPSAERTLMQRGSSGVAQSGALGESGGRGVLFEDSTDGRSGNDRDDGGSADSGDGGGADSGDDSESVDQSVIYPSGFTPGRRLAGAVAPAAGFSNALPSRATAGNTRQRRVMGGSIQKPNSSSAAIAAIAAARRVRLLRGSPPGTMPVPLPRSLSSTGNIPDSAGAASPSTAAWERNRRAAAARVSRMLADADAAETAAAAVASQSQAHSRAAAAADAAAASVRAQAVADETELAAQNSASLTTTKQTAPPVSSAACWEVEQQTSSSLRGRPASSSTLFQPLDQSQQPQRVARSPGQAQPSTAPPQGKRRARDGGLSGAIVPQVGPPGGGLGPSPRAGFEAGGPSFQSAGRTGPQVPPSFSMGAPASSHPSTFDVAAFSVAGAAVEPLPTRSSGASSFAMTTTLLAPPNGSTPTDGPEPSLWRPSSSQPTSQPASVSFGAPTPRSGAGNGGGGFGGAHSFTPPADKGPGNGPARASGDRPVGGSFGGNGFGAGLGFDGGSFGGASSLKPVGAPSGGGAGASTPASTSGVTGGLKRSPSQLALEGAAGSGGAPRAAAATSGFGNGDSPFGGGAPPASAGGQGGGGDAHGAGAPPSSFAPQPVGTSGGFETVAAAAPGAPPPARPALAHFATPTGGAGRIAGPALGAAPAPFSFGLPSPRLL